MRHVPQRKLFVETRASNFANTYETTEATNYLKNAKILKKWLN